MSQTNIQTNHNLTYGYVPELSAQQGVDCGYKAGCNGCSGGLMHKMFKYHTDPDEPMPLATMASYPYKSVEGACMDKHPDTKFAV